MTDIEKAEEAAGKHTVLFMLSMFGASFFAFLAGALAVKGTDVWVSTAVLSVGLTALAFGLMAEMLVDQKRITQMEERKNRG